MNRLQEHVIEITCQFEPGLLPGFFLQKSSLSEAGKHKY